MCRYKIEYIMGDPRAILSKIHKKIVCLHDTYLKMNIILYKQLNFRKLK